MRNQIYLTASGLAVVAISVGLVTPVAQTHELNCEERPAVRDFGKSERCSQQEPGHHPSGKVITSLVAANSTAVVPMAAYVVFDPEHYQLDPPLPTTIAKSS